jgi:hypothetical protein
MEYRPMRDCERRAERYADQADEARALGETAAADQLLLLAWAAYDDQDGALLEPDGGRESRTAEVRPLSRRRTGS